MKTTATLLTSVFALPLSAQIVITQADMPAAGDTLRYRTTVLTTFDPASTGAEHVWDYSALQAVAPGADTLVSASSTPLLFQFYFNNPILYPEHRASYAVRGGGLQVQVVTVTDMYEYFATNAASQRSVGFGANINGLPASVRRQPVDVVYRFPLAFGDVDSSFSAFELSLPTLGYFGQEQWRHNRVDGYGTLYLPADTFEVVRVESHLQRWDTLYVEQLGMGFALPEPETVEYKWLAAGTGRPVLEVITVSGVPTITRFHQGEGPVQTTVQEVAGSQPTLFPNPATDHFFYHATGREALVVRYADGRVARRLEGVRPGLQRVDLSGCAPGVYFVSQEGAQRTQRLVLAH